MGSRGGGIYEIDCYVDYSLQVTMTTGHVQGRRMRYPELESRYELHETLGTGEKRVKTTGYEQSLETHSLSFFSVQVGLQRSKQLSTSSRVKGYAAFSPLITSHT